MKSLKAYKNEWERNAKRDAFFSILSNSQEDAPANCEKRFFETGREEIAGLFDYAASISIPLPACGKALDFGCGVGRLTQALGARFKDVTGVDVSSEMIRQARFFLPPSAKNIEYTLNERSDLSLFESDQFDLIYSNIVLQHISPRLQRKYIAEFARVAKVGGWVVFQLPSERVGATLFKKVSNLVAPFLPLRIKRWLSIHLLGRQDRGVKDFEIEMNVQPIGRVKKLAEAHGLATRHIIYTNACGGPEGSYSQMRYLSREEALKASPDGMLGPMYFMQKVR